MDMVGAVLHLLPWMETLLLMLITKEENQVNFILEEVEVIGGKLIWVKNTPYLKLFIIIEQIVVLLVPMV